MNNKKKEDKVWGIKSDMFWRAGYRGYSVLQNEGDVDTMLKEATKHSLDTIHKEVVVRPDLDGYDTYILTADGLWTTSDEVRPESRILELRAGSIGKWLNGEKNLRYETSSLSGKLLLRLGLILGKRNYLRGVYEPVEGESRKTLPYELTYKDGLRYIKEVEDDLKGKVIRHFNSDKILKGVKSGRLIMSEIIDVLNTVVEIEEGLVTRYYNLIHIEDSEFRIVEPFTVLGEEDRYKELIVKGQELELDETSLLKWYYSLKELDKHLEELKRLEEHNKKMALEQGNYDKAVEYMPKYQELYSKYKGKLALSQVSERIKEVESDNQLKLESLTEDLNKLAAQVK